MGAVGGERYVVEVTAAVPDAELVRVAQVVAEELGQVPERFEVLLDGHIGPVTKPLPLASAERVTEVLCAAGVEATMIGEVAPQLSTINSAEWLMMPPDRTDFDTADVQTWQRQTPAPDPVVTSSYPSFDEELRLRRRRRLLLGALAVAVVVLVGLQGVYFLRAQSVGPPSYEAGLDAYRQGDFEVARERWLPMAWSGDARAQYMLGYLSEFGLGQLWSNAQAAGWYRQAAERGFSDAQLRLASLYERGMGVPRDEAMAVRWYRAAAELGDPQAQFELARHYFHGLGVPQDFVAARRWFERAAAAGVREGEAFVALLEPGPPALPLVAE